MQNPEHGQIPLEKELSVLAIKLSPKEIEERFIRFQEPKYHESKGTLDSEITKKLIYLQESSKINYDSFLKSQEMNDLYSLIRRSFSWKQRKYTARFEIESPNQFSLIDNEYSFELSPIDIDIIAKNKSFIEQCYKQESIRDENTQEIKWGWRNPIFQKLKQLIIFLP